MKSSIEDALKRNAELDVRRMSVAMVDSLATLEENVRSWTDRVHAENAAWSAAGVREFEDRLVMAVPSPLDAIHESAMRGNYGRRLI